MYILRGVLKIEIGTRNWGDCGWIGQMLKRAVFGIVKARDVDGLVKVLPMMKKHKLVTPVRVHCQSLLSENNASLRKYGELVSETVSVWNFGCAGVSLLGTIVSVPYVMLCMVWNIEGSGMLGLFCWVCLPVVGIWNFGTGVYKKCKASEYEAKIRELTADNKSIVELIGVFENASESGGATVMARE